MTDNNDESLDDKTPDQTTSNDKTRNEDAVHGKPTTSGHSDADSQAQRNAEDESPS